MNGLDKERLVRSVNAQIELLQELRLNLETTESVEGDAKYCAAAVRKIEAGTRRMRVQKRDFGEYRDIAVCNMLTRI